jgi:hypothetical protein
MSIWEYRAVRKHLDLMGVKDADVNEDLIFRTYEERRVMVETAKRETKAARREQQRRSNNAQITRPRAAGQLDAGGIVENLLDDELSENNPPSIGSFEIDDSNR